ncbi:MAG: hypothetical protein ACFFD4_12200 [Candidatus Odinarchaeota archaeon]
MVSEDINELKKKNWTLTQELEGYRQENARLNQTVQQWYNWSQDIQKQMQEKDQQIESLQRHINSIENEKRELLKRISTADVAMTENLYEQNKTLELKLKEVGDVVSALEDTAFRALSKNLQINPKELAGPLKNSKKTEFRVYAYLYEQGKPVRETEVVNRLSLSRKDAEQAFRKLSRERLVEEYTTGVYTVSQQVGSVVYTAQETDIPATATTPVTDPGKQDIFTVTASKLEYSSSPQEKRTILSDLKDHLIAQGLSNLAFEVLQIMRDQAGTLDTRNLQQKVREWQKIHEESQKVEVVIEEVDLNLLSTEEIFTTVRDQIKAVSGNTGAAAKYLERMKDVLMQKAVASGTLLYDMNKTVNEAKKGTVTTGYLVTKLEEWQTKLG